MKLQILGTGCAKCKKLTEVTDQAAQELGLDYEIVKVTDLTEILDFGIMSTPALAVDGKVLISGQVPTAEKAKKLLEPYSK